MLVLKRLDQTLSNLGYCSRREVRYLIKNKRLRIDGELATNAAQKVDPNAVSIDGQPLEHIGNILVMLHKPAMSRSSLFLKYQYRVLGATFAALAIIDMELASKPTSMKSSIAASSISSAFCSKSSTSS